MFIQKPTPRIISAPNTLEAEMIPDPPKPYINLSYWSCAFSNKLTVYLYTVLLPDPPKPYINL